MALGVWLPLALADLRKWLEALATGRSRSPVAEILRAWSLPELGAAYEETMKGIEGDNLIERIFALGEKYGN